MKGEMAQALSTFRTLYGYGADPVQVALDLLDHCHGASVAKALGPDALVMPKEQAARLAAIGATASAGALARVWQMLLKAHEEVRKAPDPAAALEMALIRLTYAADLPGPEEALKRLQSGQPIATGGPGPSGGPSGGGGGGGAATARQLAPAVAAAPAQPQLASFEDVVKMIEAKRDIGLKLDVDRFVRLVSFRQGAIEFEPAPGAPSNLAGRIAKNLKEWTGQTWLVATAGGGGESIDERRRREQREERAAIEADPFVRSVMEAFPGAEIIEVRIVAPPENVEPPPPEAEDD
jgi:DNA polymerase-3 subunit gamma/tau